MSLCTDGSIHQRMRQFGPASLQAVRESTQPLGRWPAGTHPSWASSLPKSRTQAVGCPLMACTKPASRSHCSQAALQAASGEPGGNAERRDLTTHGNTLGKEAHKAAVGPVLPNPEGHAFVSPAGRRKKFCKAPAGSGGGWRRKRLIKALNVPSSSAKLSASATSKGR